jgi:hypothetical protein
MPVRIFPEDAIIPVNVRRNIKPVIVYQLRLYPWMRNVPVPKYSHYRSLNNDVIILGVEQLDVPRGRDKLIELPNRRGSWRRRKPHRSRI